VKRPREAQKRGCKQVMTFRVLKAGQAAQAGMALVGRDVAVEAGGGEKKNGMGIEARPEWGGNSRKENSQGEKWGH